MATVSDGLHEAHMSGEDGRNAGQSNVSQRQGDSVLPMPSLQGWHSVKAVSAHDTERDQWEFMAPDLRKEVRLKRVNSWSVVPDQVMDDSDFPCLQSQPGITAARTSRATEREKGIAPVTAATGGTSASAEIRPNAWTQRPVPPIPPHSRLPQSDEEPGTPVAQEITSPADKNETGNISQLGFAGPALDYMIGSPTKWADVMDEHSPVPAEKNANGRPPEDVNHTPDRGNTAKRRSRTEASHAYRKVETFSQLILGDQGGTTEVETDMSDPIRDDKEEEPPDRGEGEVADGIVAGLIPRSSQLGDEGGSSSPPLALPDLEGSPSLQHRLHLAQRVNFSSYTKPSG
ncbi:hypothetical protein R1sor_019221 [Riccia sorocarpa]|uniref:Uncharacterized protein n=1 Tax=Riccia sorocarpa TaxID=122646 RepID=A0ABD3IDM7_9MARC